jgi:hypothetical protein
LLSNSRPIEKAEHNLSHEMVIRREAAWVVRPPTMAEEQVCF